MEPTEVMMNDEDDDDAYEEPWLARIYERLETLCDQLRRNEVSAVYNWQVYSDGFAFSLASSLAATTSLKRAEWIIWAGVTQMGAMALARGVDKNASLQVLAIDTEGAKFAAFPVDDHFLEDQTTTHLDGCLWCLYLKAITRVRELGICCDLGNTNAMRLGAALRDNQNITLEKLSLKLLSVAVPGARALVKGIRKSAISTLHLYDASLKVYRYLFSLKGIFYHVPKLASLDISINPRSPRPPVGWSVLGEELDQTTTSQQNQQTSCLETVSLSSRGRWLGDQAVQRLLKAMPENSKLKRLKLDSSKITDQGVALLVASWKEWPQLEELCLSWNDVTGVGLRHLFQATHPLFKSLDLSYCYTIGELSGLLETAPELVHAMQQHHGHIQNLDLKSCWLRDTDVAILSKGLQNNSTVKKLTLRNNWFRDDGVASLVNSLHQGLFSLEELDLSFNKISLVGAHSLVKVSSKHPCLKILDLQGCNRIDYAGLSMIANDLSSSKLSKLTLMNVEAKKMAENNSPAAKEQEAVCNMASRALVGAVKCNMHLQHLNLDAMELPLWAKNQIQFFLDLERSGRQLLRLDDGLDPFGLWCHVLAKCSSNKDVSVLYYLLGEQPMLVPSFCRHGDTEATGTSAGTAATTKQ